MIVGLDEAGRGPLAGPVITCALYLKKEPDFVKLNKLPQPDSKNKALIHDSKTLSEKKRRQAYKWLCDIDNAVFAVGKAEHTEIDELNILAATMLAFNRAIRKLLSVNPYLQEAKFIVDGNIFRTNYDINYRCLKNADKLVESVSCASIVAKVVRDSIMQVYHDRYPQWNFAKHKGYPTKEHCELLKEHKLSPIHRRTFKPCKDV
ncbi:MAG: ribonuclease HII [Candidatus Omnitrophica bacterium]|nr:ribonuclease HII [Candidatus Omnitrophota bacterium]MDD5440963.1 ribonuclease HII [Candidatus Omnitrophota bacterium]